MLAKVKVLSVEKTGGTYFPDYTITLEHLPGLFGRLIGRVPRTEIYRGNIVWRNMLTGARVDLFFGSWLQEAAESHYAKEKFDSILAADIDKARNG